VIPRIVGGSCDQHAGDADGAHGATAQDARTLTPVQDRRWLHPAWVATDGAVRNLVRRSLERHDALTGWAARIGIARPTLSRLLDSPQGPLVGDLALLPADALHDVLDAWRAEIARVGALHRSVNDVLADVVRECSDVTTAVLTRGTKADTLREIDEAVRGLQALRARVEVSP
jgi:hypothetical protein